MNAVTLGPTERIAKSIARFRAAWREHAAERKAIGTPVKEPLIGAMRAVVVADSDAEAVRIAAPAYEQWFENLCWLWKENGAFPPIALAPGFAEARASGAIVAGAPETVRRTLAAQAESCGFNYLVMQLAFGTLGHEQEMRSLALLGQEVMPALARVEVAAL
jgi:alkanesulfonate monooxygenase SsuD/methylene tetrahydromethanopterin reductase-like flavin-dependent oxidoreductase (luciferase family)